MCYFHRVASQSQGRSHGFGHDFEDGKGQRKAVQGGTGKNRMCCKINYKRRLKRKELPAYNLQDNNEGDCGKKNFGSRSINCFET